ncbi:MAG: tRNA (adenosine(37)-N6)-threonylcarbamoyltransferase complex transferase subunit TsaD [Ignavibacteria bacterium]|jgi:N6-L-threonylcarbamoyladenine synthase
MMDRIILAIESSCDETSAAIICNDEVLSNVISSQTIHEQYGGVIPELASRAHLQAISLIVDKAMKDSGKEYSELTSIAVTTQPGLAGALLVGSSFAKGLGLKLGIPVIPVHHIEGHIYSGMIEHAECDFPFIALIVSGGHTSIFLVRSFGDEVILGSTKDDAAGEAFDKIGKMLGLGYPAGPRIDALAKEGNPKAYVFPRALMHEQHYDFSFSGLKTSVRYFLQREFPQGIPNEAILKDICASVQEAIIEVLIHKLFRASKEHRINNIIVAGGVSANSRLREALQAASQKRPVNVFLPKLSYCMDNAAMIGFLGSLKLKYLGEEAFHSLQFTVNPRSIRTERISS